jgi:glycosyltransferase involved in cell wall biosynthesis
MKPPTVLLLGPDRATIGGVQTHVNVLLDSELAARFGMVQFQVGSAGRGERAAGMLARLAASPFQLAAAIARSGAGIVHVNTSFNQRAYWRDLLYVLAARLCGVRVVYQIHGGGVRMLQGAGRLRAPFMRWLLRRTLRWPHVVVVISRRELDAVSQLAPQQNIRFVPNAIDAAGLLAQRRAPSDPAAPLRLLYVGRLVRDKGLFELVQGLALARSRGVAAQLVIAGEGPDEPALRESVRQLEVNEQVSFAGAAFGERKDRLLAQAEVFALPSYHEGLPYALLEGMAAGLVPLATRVGAIPDVVADGVHGLLIESRDPAAVAQAIAALAGNRARLERMSAACRDRIASAYSIERLARDFTALYASLGAAAADLSRSA